MLTSSFNSHCSDNFVETYEIVPNFYVPTTNSAKKVVSFTAQRLTLHCFLPIEYSVASDATTLQTQFLIEPRLTRWTILKLVRTLLR